MTKKERVLTAINGGTPDHVPTCFSLHFPKDVAFGEEGVNTHLEFFKQTDTDVLKIMNENLVPYMGEIKKPDDWNQIRNISLSDKFMVNQIDMVARILDKCEKDAYVIGTLHGTVASGIHPIEDLYGYKPVRELFCTHLREKPQPMIDAFKRLSEGMCELAQKLIAMGVDGIYYAALGGENYYFTDEEFEKYIAPLDKMILSSIKETGGHTFLHMCKDKLNLERYESYSDATDVVNWGVYDENISLDEGRKIFRNTTIMGGLQNRAGVIVDGNDMELTEEIARVIATEGKTNFILGADCTLFEEIDYSRIKLISQVARSI